MDSNPDLRQLGSGIRPGPELLDEGDLTPKPIETDGSKKAFAALSSKWLVVLAIGSVAAIFVLIVLLPFARLFSGGASGSFAGSDDEASELETIQAERDRARSEADRAEARLLFEQQQRRTLPEPEATPQSTEGEPSTGTTPTPRAVNTTAPVAARPAPAPRPVAPPAPAPVPAASTPASPPPNPEETWKSLQETSIAFADFSDEESPASAPAPETAGDPPPAERSPEEVAISAGVSLDEVLPPPPLESETPSSVDTIASGMVSPGTMVPGKQMLPATWNAASERSGGIAAVRLEKPLADRSGEVVLPKGALLVTEVVAVTDNGWVEQRAVAARWQDAESGRELEVPLPPDAISIRGKEGEPLIAEVTNDSRKAEGRMRRNRAVLGAVASIGEELTEPTSSSTITSSGLGSISTSTTSDGDSNIAGAALEGFGEALLESSGSTTRDPGEPIYLVEANTRVEIVVEASFSLPVPPAS